MNTFRVPDATNISDYSPLLLRENFLTRKDGVVKMKVEHDDEVSLVNMLGAAKQNSPLTPAGQLTLSNDENKVVSIEENLDKKSLTLTGSGHKYKMLHGKYEAENSNVILLAKKSADTLGSLRCQSLLKYKNENFWRLFYNEVKFSGADEPRLCLSASTFKSAKLCSATYNNEEYYGLFFPKKEEYGLSRKIITRKEVSSTSNKHIGLVYTGKFGNTFKFYLALIDDNGNEINSANRIPFTQLTPESGSSTYWNYGGFGCYWFCCKVGDLRKLAGIAEGTKTGADIDDMPDSYYIYFDLYINVSNYDYYFNNGGKWSGDRIYIYPSLISAEDWNNEKTLTGTTNGKYVQSEGVMCAFHYNPDQDENFRYSQNAKGSTYYDYFFLCNNNIWRVDSKNVQFYRNVPFLLISLYTSVTFEYEYGVTYEMKIEIPAVNVKTDCSGILEGTGSAIDSLPTGYTNNDIKEIRILSTTEDKR